MTYIKEYPVLDSSGSDKRFVGNRPAKGFVYDTVKCAFRKIGTEKWFSDKEILNDKFNAYPLNH
jgi:hypothetical protein